MVRKRENTTVRQKQIVEAAQRLIIKYGSEHLTVSRIAKETRLSEGAIYRHFKSKREILSFLLDHAEGTLMGDLALESIPSRVTLDTVSSVLKNHLQAIERRHGSSFQVIAEIVSFGDRKLNKKALEIIQKYINRLKDFLAEGIKSGEVSENIDPKAAATLFFGMMNSLVSLWALSGYSFKLEEEYLALWNSLRRAIERAK